jgi:cell division protein FtsB
MVGVAADAATKQVAVVNPLARVKPETRIRLLMAQLAELRKERDQLRLEVERLRGEADSEMWRRA